MRATLSFMVAIILISVAPHWPLYKESILSWRIEKANSARWAIQLAISDPEPNCAAVTAWGGEHLICLLCISGKLRAPVRRPAFWRTFQTKACCGMQQRLLFSGPQNVPRRAALSQVLSIDTNGR
jgi:hypothetical protein